MVRVTSSNILTVFPGWNVWSVYQVKDLPTTLMMMGVTRDRQLQIWVEDAVRLGAGGAIVADPVDLKGSQVQILQGPPTDLEVEERKEDVPGASAMTVSGPADLRYVRFYNRGTPASMNWPHDENYLLNEVYHPSEKSPETKGPPPPTVTNNLGSQGGEVLGEALKGLAIVGGGLLLLNFGANIWLARRRT